MNNFLSIQEAAAFGVSMQPLRRWEKQKKITPVCRTKGNQRRYDPASLKSLCSFQAP